MFPDPNKRLSVVSSFSPSIRSAALQGGGAVNLQGGNFNPQGAPVQPQYQQPQIQYINPKVQVAQPGGIQVGNRTVYNSGGRTNVPGYQPGDNWFQNAGSRLVDDFIRPFVATPIDLGYVGARAVGGSRIGKSIGFVAPQSTDSGPQWLANLAEGSGATGTARNLAGNAAQLALTVGAGGVDSLGGSIAKGTIGRFAGPLVTKLAGKTVGGALVLGPYNTAGLVGSDEKLTPGNVAKSFGQGAAVGAGLGAAGGVLGAGFNKVFKGNAVGDTSIDKNTLNFLRKEKDPGAIHAVLQAANGGHTNPGLQQAAMDIAHSKSTKFILNRLADIPQEAGIAGAVAEGVAHAVGSEKDIIANDAGTQTGQPQTPPTTRAWTEEEMKALEEQLNAQNKNATDTAHTGIPGADNAPAALRGEPQTVGEAAFQANHGVNNLSDDTFNADKRINATAEPGSGPEDIPAFIKQDPNKAIADANTNLQRIDAELTKIGSGQTNKFKAKQALADELRAHPDARDAILAKYAHSANAFDEQAAEEETKRLLVERQQHQTVLNLAKQAQEAPSVPPEVPPEQVIAQEAAAQNAARTPQTAPEAGAPESSTTSVENSPTGVADQVNANADEGLPAATAEKVPALVRHFGSKETVVRKVGTPSATQLADEMRLTENEAQQLRAEYKNNVNLAYKLSKPELQNLGEVVEHGATPVNSKVAEAAAQWDANAGLPYNDYVGVGGKTGFIENHFPRHYNPDTFKPGSAAYQQAIDHLVATKQAATATDAARILGRFKRADSVKPGFFGNFDKSRLDLGKDNYTYSHDALEKYHNGAAVRTAQANHFGPSGEKAADMLANIQKEGGDAGLARDALSNYIAPPDTTASALGKTGGVVRGLFSASRLGKAVISHAGQTSNVALVARTRDLATGWARYLSGNAADRRFIKEADVNNPFNLHGIQEQTTGVGGLASRVTAPLLTQMMKINRGVTALAARDYGKYLVKNGNEAELRKLGVTGDIGPELTTTQSGQIARGLVNETMFNPSRLSTPVGAESTTGKFLGQYRLAYSYKQTGLLWNRVVKEAGKGNIKPLVKFLAISAPVGVGTELAKSAVSGSNSFGDEGIGGKIADTAAMLGGIPGELLVQGARYGKRDILKTVAGSVAPIAGEAVDIGERAQKAISGNLRPIERYAAGLLPVAGTRVANKFAPNPTRSQDTNKVLKNGETEVPLLDGQGHPITDTKGKPATVIIPKGVDGVAKDILVSNARQRAENDNIKSSLSPNEKVLYDTPDTQLKQLLADNKMSQDTYNTIMAYKKVSSNLLRTDPVLPKTLDQNVKDYLTQTSKLTDQGKDNWMKNKKGQALQQKVADELNSQLPSGLDKLPPSKELLDAYATFDKQRADAAANKDPRKQWDEIVARGKLRDFWKNAAEKSLPKDVKEVYDLSMTQLKDYFLKNNKITRAQLEAAVGLNDDLLAADLSDSDKYSKKFRATYGLPAAPDNGAAGGTTKGSYTRLGRKGSGGGSGKATSSGGVSTKIPGAFGSVKTESIDPNTGLATNKGLGLSQLLPKNMSFKAAAVDTTPTKKTFKITLPADLTGHPRPSRVVSLRAKRARIL